MKFRLVSIFKCLLCGYRQSVFFCKWCPTSANTCGQSLFLCWEINYMGKFTSQLTGRTARSSRVRRQKATDNHSRPATLSISSTQSTAQHTEYILCANARGTEAFRVKSTLKPRSSTRASEKARSEGESCAFSHRPKRAKGNPEFPRMKHSQQWLSTNTVQSCCLQSVLCES